MITVRPTIISDHAIERAMTRHMGVPSLHVGPIVERYAAKVRRKLEALLLSAEHVGPDGHWQIWRTQTGHLLTVDVDGVVRTILP
jgi:hypothetical protein